MDVRDAVFLVIVFFFKKVLSVNAENIGTQFQIDVEYNGAFCSDESDVNSPVSSDILCAHGCSHSQNCKGFFYNTITGKCSSVKNVPHITEACQDKLGSVFYRKLACEISNALVTGPHGIGDGQISATSYENSGGWRPEHGRLNNDKTWVTSTLDLQQYIQFEFHGNRIVDEIITQGGVGEMSWVTSFKILFSTDCASFMDYYQTFKGNSDGNSHVSNEIDPVIVAKCVRVNPQTWNNAISIRIELMGCQL